MDGISTLQYYVFYGRNSLCINIVKIRFIVAIISWGFTYNHQLIDAVYNVRGYFMYTWNFPLALLFSIVLVA